jgi:PadR family transcriptional regulator, regulatory protein AphA
MSSNGADDLTPTSYAMLGLLSLRPWTTYELAKQMQRSVRWFWPRAERKLYEEPKRLAGLGLATTTTASTGRRPKTVYDITGAGRRALRDWLGDGPGSPLAVEMEPLVRVFFADGGSMAGLRANLRGITAQADDSLADLGAMAVASAAGDDEFPRRRATNALALELCVRLQETVRDWSQWAHDETGRWAAAPNARADGPPERGRELFAAIATRTGSA